MVTCSIKYVASLLHYPTCRNSLLPPANEVWGKIIFLHLFVILFTGGGAWSWEGVPGPGGCLVPGGGLLWEDAWSWGVPGPRGACQRVSAPGGAWSWGVSAPGGVWSQGGAWWRPPDGYCCGRYASYWDAFLFTMLEKKTHKHSLELTK